MRSCGACPRLEPAAARCRFRARLSHLSTHVDTYVDDDPLALVFGGAQGGVLRAGQWRSRFWRPATNAAGLTACASTDLRHGSCACGSRRRECEAHRHGPDTSISVALDRYGHLFEGHEEHVLSVSMRSSSSRLRCRRVTTDPAGFPGNAELAIVAGEKRASDQGEDGGRTPTRTADLCRVKAAL